MLHAVKKRLVDYPGGNHLINLQVDCARQGHGQHYSGERSFRIWTCKILAIFWTLCLFAIRSSWNLEHACEYFHAIHIGNKWLCDSLYIARFSLRCFTSFIIMPNRCLINLQKLEAHLILHQGTIHSSRWHCMSGNIILALMVQRWGRCYVRMVLIYCLCFFPFPFPCQSLSFCWLSNLGAILWSGWWYSIYKQGI